MTNDSLRAAISRPKRFKGIAINSGVIVGHACMYAQERYKVVPQYSLVTSDAISQELQRFEDVIIQCSDELTKIAEDVASTIGKAESEIFHTQQHIMTDPKVLSAIRAMVTNDKRNIEWSISIVLSGYEERFAKLDNQYLRERATDIGEIRRRLLGRLSNKKSGFICHGKDRCLKGANRIIVSEELTPDMIVNMKIDEVLGFVTQQGGITSHAAIIARSLGIPSVSGVHDIMDYVRCGDILLVDGDNGDVYLEPDDSTLSKLVPVERIPTDELCVLGSPQGTEILANASMLEDVKHAVNVGADGIGLFRTEILFMKEDRLLSEDEQFQYYKDVMELMDGKPVTFRLLDIGGDKPLPFLRLRQEANPNLGWRGSRFLLGNPTIFESQIRALARLTKFGPIRIMFPMVIDSAQMKQLLTFSHNAITDIPYKKDNLEFGAMFEVPSAFLDAENIFRIADFGSIGSNDLIQYLFAIDRGNELVSHDFDPQHPVLWNMLSSLSQVAIKFRKPLSICGEMTGREGISSKLLSIGIKSLSVSARLIPRVRNEMARFMNNVAVLQY